MHLKSVVNTLSLRDTLVAKFQKNARSNIILKISIWSIGILAVFGISCIGCIVLYQSMNLQLNKMITYYLVLIISYCNLESGDHFGSKNLENLSMKMHV